MIPIQQHPKQAFFNMISNYRPWGKLEWLLSRLSAAEYNYYGCLSPEDRCIAPFNVLKQTKAVLNHRFLEIVDPDNTDAHKQNRRYAKAHLDKINEGEINIKTVELLGPINIVYEDINTFIEESNGIIVLDISAFPKRFFFPLVKILLRSKKVKTLLVTYSTPERYSDSSLSDNPMDWSHIPMFDSDDPDVKFETALVGLGFMPLGLSTLLKDKFSDLELKLMFPFPPGAPFFQRTWKFIEDMQVTPKIDFKQIMRVDTLNVSDTFDFIKSLSPENRPILIAPYGPKTMSLAMCLFACRTDSPVYYTQPTSYDPKYSIGVTNTYGYCVKLQGESLFF